MKTLAQEWTEYSIACYPEGASVMQAMETRQAFFAGALVALQTMTVEVAALPTQDAEKCLAALVHEATETCRQNAQWSNRGNN